MNLQSVAAAVVDGKEISLQAVLYTLKLKGQLDAIVAQTITDQLIAAAADQEGMTVTAAGSQKAANAFRVQRGLHRADATQSWRRSNHLTREDLEAGLG